MMEDTANLRFSYNLPKQSLTESEQQALASRIRLYTRQCMKTKTRSKKDNVHDPEDWMAITTCSGVNPADPCRVAVIFPLWTFSIEDGDRIRHYVTTRLQRLPVYQAIQESDYHPVDVDGWDEPLLYHALEMTHTARPIDVVHWLASNSSQVKRRSDAYQQDDPFTLWSSKALYTAKNYVEPKVSEGMAAAMIDAGIVNNKIPSFRGAMKDQTQEYENWRAMHDDLVKIIQSQYVTQQDVWMDVVASLIWVTGKGNDPEVIEEEMAMVNKSFVIEMGSSMVEYIKYLQGMWRTGKLTISPLTLAERISQLCPMHYEQWLDGRIDYVLNCLYLEHPMKRANLAEYLSKLFMKRFQLDYVYSENDSKWFRYNSQRYAWEEARGIKGAPLEIEIAAIVRAKLQVIEMSDEPIKEGITTLFECGNLLVDREFRRTVESQTTHKMAVENFSKKRDLNTHVMPLYDQCLEVVDVKGLRQVRIRPHRRQDYITRPCATPYYPHYHWGHPQVQQAMRFMTQFIPDSESRETLLHWMGSALYRGNRDRLILVILGPGGNGKTAFLAFLQEVFHDYMVLMKSNVFYGRESASATADTDLEGIAGAAIAYIEEVDNGKRMRMSRQKAISGGGKLRIRRLYQSEISEDTTAKLLYVLNTPPIFPNDRATRDRILFIRATSRFDEHAPTDPVEQDRTHHYPADTSFSKQAPVLASAFLWIMFEYLKRYLEVGIPRSTQSNLYAEKYWRHNDIYREFLEACYLETKDPEILSVNDMVLKANKYFRDKRHLDYSAHGLLDYIRQKYGESHQGSPGYNEDEGTLFAALSERLQ